MLSLNNKGMSTIEACIIIPVCFAIIFLLFGMTIYYYDQSVLSAAAAGAAIKGGEYSYKDNNEILEIVKRQFKYLAEDSLILLQEPQINTLVTATEIKVNVVAEFDLYFFNRLGLFEGDNRMEINITEYAPRLKPSVFVRTVATVRDKKKSNTRKQED